MYVSHLSLPLVAHVFTDSPRFYRKVGLGAHAFDYNIASATAGWAGCLLGMIASDVFGRRDLLIWGCITFSLFLFLISGLGLHQHPSTSEKNGLVASVVLYIFIFTGFVRPYLLFGTTQAKSNAQDSGSHILRRERDPQSFHSYTDPYQDSRSLPKFPLQLYERRP